MICEEYKELHSEWLAVRGEWIHARLNGGNRPAGVTEAKSKELINRLKATMDEIESTMIVHAGKCKICNLEQSHRYHDDKNEENIA